MGTWFSKELGDRVEASAATARIQAAFDAVFTGRGIPDGAVVMSKDEWRETGKIVTAYFSPAASEVARACGAVPCNRPTRQGLSLESGDMTSLAALFPEAQ